MTLKQIRFKHRVENSLKGYIAISTGKCSGCKSCNKEENEPEIEVDETGEPYFSWHPCVLCHSRLGGGREDVHAVDEKNK